MKANERFNQTIDTIEKLVVDPAMDARSIGEAAARKNGIAFRDLSTVFSFLIDTTLNSYVISRKLDAAYRFLIHSETKRISEAVEIAGYGDQPSFNKAFKRQYNLTPGEAFHEKDPSLCSDPITWEMLSNDLSFETNRKEEDDKVQETKIFGVSASDYDRISKINELESFYGLSRMFSEYAYELANEKGYSLEDCFKYAESLHDYGGDYDYYDPEDPEWPEPVPEEDLREVGNDPLIQKLFFERGISVDTSKELLEEFGATEEELLRCDPSMLKFFPGYAADDFGYESFLPVLRFSYFMKAYDYFVEQLDPRKYEQAFEYYIGCVADGIPMQSALEATWNEGFVNEKEDIDDPSFWFDPRELIIDREQDEKYEYLEAFAREQESWNNVRIDDDMWKDPDDEPDDDE